VGTVANLSVKIGANTQDFNAGLNKMAGEVQGISSRLSAAGAVIAGAFSFRAIGSGIQDVLDKTSRIADGAARIGVSAEAFQKLSFAAQQSGGSMTAIETAMRVMSDRITDGKLPKALTDMGISLDALKQMTPDQAFLTIANAIQNMPNQFEQTSTAVDMFGRGAQALLPAIKAGFDDVAASAPHMSGAVVLAGDQMGDKWLEMQTKIDNLRAQALLPLLDGFLKLPESVQIGAAGLLTFLPALEPLVLALIAFGGPTGAMTAFKGAFLGLAGFFTSTLPAAFAVVVTFFTTTLPAAFGAVVAFLGPQGLIALALLALAAIWYKWGDDIKAFLAPWIQSIAGFFHTMKNQAVAYSQQLFEGVKTWIVDKFNAIVEQIRQKVGMVTGFFKDMYMKVVGGSFVPDMVNGIGHWFGQLTNNMVNPTASATGAVTSLFHAMADSVSRTIDGLISKIPVVGGALSEIFGAVGGLGGILDMLGVGGKEGKSGGLLGGLLGGFGGGAGSTAGGGSAGGMGWLGGLLSGGLPLLPSLIGAIGNKLKGGEEGMLVNPARDAYAAGIRAQYGGANNFEGLVNALAGSGITGDRALGLISVLQSADTMAAFNAATEAIDRAIDSGGDGAAGGGVNVTITVSAIDAAGVSDFVGSSDFTQSLTDVIQRNVYGARTDLQAALGVT
jgi:hypothetical protein